MARRQAGVLTRAQALTCGIATRTVAARVSDGRWRRVLPGVYLVEGHRYDDEARARAAWLWAGPEALLSGPTAAWWFGMLPRSAPTVELTIPIGAHRRPQPGIVLRRRTVAPADRSRQRGVALTARPRTVLETALVAGPAFLDRALQRWVSLPQLVAARDRMAGRHGAAAAGRLLAAATEGTRSDAERTLLRLLRAAGITGWVVGMAFESWTLDLAFPEHRLAVELDGWAWHSDVERFRTDRGRQNALVLAGWTMLRFTWHDLTHREHSVVAEIRAALAARSAA